MTSPPILFDKHPDAPSVFAPEALLREARRQRGLEDGDVPAVGLLDPDGDLARHLRATGRSALRDEGTSHHYAPPTDYAEADPRLVAVAMEALARLPQRGVRGAGWTTDAPYRETEAAIAAALARGILAVEMEAAALYAFAAARGQRLLCLAHVTHTMGIAGDDFEKGEADGTADALAVLGAVVEALSHDQPDP